MRPWPLVLGLASLATLGACGGGSPSATPTTTTAPTATTAPSAPPCTASSVSAAIDFTKFGGTSSSLAGAVIFTDTAGAACALHGVPRVQVLMTDGQTIPIYQAPAPPGGSTVVLGPTTRGASSITFSSWGCTPGSFTLTVQFPGWTSSVPAASEGSTTSTTGPTSNVTGPPCTAAKEVNQTIYISPVTAVTS